MTDRLRLALALQNVRGLGPAKIKRALAGPLDLDCAPDASAVAEIASRLGVRASHEDALKALGSAGDTMDACERARIVPLALGTSDYPEDLALLSDPPPVLYARGVFRRDILAVIGTRRPSSVGEAIGQRISRYFVDSGWTVCNGLAEGIDAAAVEGHAVTAGRVLGVLAGGLDFGSSKTVSKVVSARADRVLDGGGALVSEAGPGTREDTYSVVKSCRLQAGLSRGAILVESGADGGSRFTIEALAPLGRPMGVVRPPSSVTDLGAFALNMGLLQPSLSSPAKLEKVWSRAAGGWRVVPLATRDDYGPFERLLEGQHGSDQPSLFGT